MRVCLLASGSKGNSLFIDTGSVRLLVDAGLAAVELSRRLTAVGVDPGGLDAVLVTHEHTDHIRGAGTLARKWKLPVLISYPTHRAIADTFKKTEVIEFESGHSFSFKDVMIDPFPITHDACDPVGFVIESASGRIGVATDLGIATRLVQEKLRNCRALVLESNHDEEMLMNGPYPWHLKQRIRSRHGHLSNTESANLLDELSHPGLEGIFLAHLSEVNNDPEVAQRVALSLLTGWSDCSPRVIVGAQHQPSELLTI